MFLRFLFICSLLLLSPYLTYAQEEVTVNEVPPKEASIKISSQILDRISSEIGKFATKNILEPEQVFCYQIATPPENYNGYTLDGFAIAGFCGIINKKLQKSITAELLNNPKNIIFDKVEDCVIRPQVMLRFIKGVDYTDVLLSSPCHAIAIFYGGKASAFNAKPAALTINNIIKPLLYNKVDFVSPSLFNQTLPIGVAKTDEQKALIEQKSSHFYSWQQKQQQIESKSSGWNKLKSQQ